MVFPDRVVKGTDLSFNTDFKTAVYYNGRISWAPGFRWKTTCEVNLRYFPYDEQTCSLNFTNWISTATMVNFTNGDSQVILDIYEPNGEWELIKTETYRYV